jgi:hypothetical protein
MENLTTVEVFQATEFYGVEKKTQTFLRSTVNSEQ